MTACEESQIIREMTIACFSPVKANGQFVPFDLRYFIELTVFTLLSYKGKKSILFSPCLHSILNTCNVSPSSFIYI